MEKNNQNLAMRISMVSVIGNLLLSAGKLIAGFLGNSAAMISDGVHSASDLLSTLIVIVGINISGKAADEKHPYGHERLESVVAVILGIVLMLTGGLIGYSGVAKIIHINTEPIPIPGILPLVAAIISIISKEAMYQYTIRGARKINSDMLKADAWHHRSDALSSIGSLIGIGGARLGYSILDPLASIVICFMIIKVAFNIMGDAFSKMTDSSVDSEINEQIRSLVLKQEGVKRVDVLRTRSFSSRFYVDMEIAVDGNMPLYEAHAIAERVHHTVEAGFPLAKHCMVHVNPYQEALLPEKQNN